MVLPVLMLMLLDEMSEINKNITMKKLQYILLCTLLLFVAACEKDTLPMNFSPALTTGAASDIYRVGATLSGSIQKSDGVVVKDCGILISELQSMAEYTEIKTASTENTFNVSVQNLEPGKKYYYCAYAGSGYSIARGEIKEFTTTDSNAPVFSELAVSGKDEKSFTVATTILDEGGTDLILCGFCWKLAENSEADPTVEDNVSNVTAQSAAITARIKDLTPNKNYLVRAYGINGRGVGYGKTISISTNNATVPAVSSITPADSTALSISVKASILSAGESSVSEIGFCWSSETQEPTTAHLKYNATDQLEHAQFTAAIADLKPETTYYIRAYAINEQGTGYGDVYTYTTSKGLAVTTLKVDVNGTSIKAYGQVTSGTQNYHHGFDVATNKDDLLNRTGSIISEDVHTNLSYNESDGTFNGDIDNLNVNTVYYIRAWFMDFTSQDITFGNVIEFVTKDALGIYTLQDLMAFRDARNSNADVSRWKNSEGVINIMADIDLGTIDNWQPISTVNPEEVIDGNNHIISNVKRNVTMASEWLGFFVENNGTIRNLTLTGEMTSTVDDALGGAFCLRSGGVISNCHNYINITATGKDVSVGGICYEIDGIIQNCTNHGNIKATSACGIAFPYDYANGDGKGGMILDCQNYGTIECNGNASESFGCYIGGIALSCRVGTVMNCINEGKVMAVNGYFAGGISASVDVDSKITGCQNKGEVIGGKQTTTGGIIGTIQADNVLVDNCVNIGTITSTGVTGGICGVVRGTNIVFTNNTNGGTINGTAGTEANAIGYDERAQ